jgi:hypothetical protein
MQEIQQEIIPIQPLKIRGWLILIAVSLILNIIFSTSYLVDYTSRYAKETAPLIKCIYLYYMVFCGTISVFFIFTSYCFFKKKKMAPYLIIAGHVLCILFQIGIILYLNHILPSTILPSILPDLFNTLNKLIPGSVLSFLYLIKSKRVKQTFVN